MKNYIFGLHAVEALLRQHPERIVQISLQQDRQDKKLKVIEQLADQHGVGLVRTSKKSLDELTKQANHQGVLAHTKKQKQYSESDIAELLEQTTEPPFILVLDNVQDPHNLGACFRSADAAGVQMIIAPKDKAVGITPTVAKVASGAVETVPFIQVTNLARTLSKLKDMGVWLYGLAGEASDSLYATDFTGPTALVMGAEGDGLRRLTRESCDVLVHIPMQGTVSSLNVSVAAGVCLFDVRRQRTVNKS